MPLTKTSISLPFPPLALHKQNMPHSTKPQHTKQTTSKVEENEATPPKPPKKPTSKVDEHTLPQPKMTTKDLYWRCCCEHENFGGEFPQQCKKCEHFWCAECPFSYSGGKAVLGVCLRD